MAVEQQRLYDADNDRLIYFRESATPEFWDRHWESYGIDNLIRSGYDARLLRITGRYLPDLSSRILEGGCGVGAKVATLVSAGYTAVGIDYAERTLEIVLAQRPDLDLRFGDVRALDFPDDSFDGYWSIGVIEHFWNGYEPILAEAHRVVRPGGYLFLSFPQLSIARQMRCAMGLHARYSTDGGTLSEPDGFYQFALSPSRVIRDLTAAGLNVQSKSSYDGLTGFGSDVPFMGRFVDWLSKGLFLPKRLFRRTLQTVASPILGHSCLLVAKNN